MLPAGDADRHHPKGREHEQIDNPASVLLVWFNQASRLIDRTAFTSRDLFFSSR